MDMPNGTAKYVMGALGLIGGILAAYFAIEAWADDRYQKIPDALMQQARNEVQHDKITQQQQMEYHETQLSLKELEAKQIEAEIGGDEPTARESRIIERIEDAIRFHDQELSKLRSRMSSDE